MRGAEFNVKEKAKDLIPEVGIGTEGILTMDFIRVVLSVIIPPLGVFLQVGIGKQFWINVILTLLGYIPGLVHAIWIIATRGKKGEAGG